MRHDTDGDGRISRDEAPQRLKQRFDRIDLDGDGYIDEDELAALRQRSRDRSGRRGQPD
jgi:collagen type III alpha